MWGNAYWSESYIQFLVKLIEHLDPSNLHGIEVHSGKANLSQLIQCIRVMINEVENIRAKPIILIENRPKQRIKDAEMILKFLNKLERDGSDIEDGVDFVIDIQQLRSSAFNTKQLLKWLEILVKQRREKIRGWHIWSYKRQQSKEGAHWKLREDDIYVPWVKVIPRFFKEGDWCLPELWHKKYVKQAMVFTEKYLKNMHKS